MDEHEKTFGDRLRELRKERKLRQDDVADALNVSRQTISKYERDEREPDFYAPEDCGLFSSLARLAF